MDSNWDERRPRKNVHMYGRLIVCTRVPACKSSALATALPNPGQEARLHYMCGQEPVSLDTGCPTQLDQFMALEKKKCGKEEWRKKKLFFSIGARTHISKHFYL